MLPSYNLLMKIFMVCPAPRGSRKGNRVTADRWARILRRLGHHPKIRPHYDGSSCALMIALHARKSAESIRAFRQIYPYRPVLLCLTGTDLYRDIRTSQAARQSLEIADRLIVLQPHGLDELPAELHAKARVIIQSAQPIGLANSFRSADHIFNVIVLGHLRAEKDPFRTPLALRLLPKEVPIRVTHLGQALSPPMARQARRLAATEARYRWLGEIPRADARRTLARSHVLVLSSRMEGGANVISEALADGVPVLASRISGNVGLLGDDYPGLFPVGDSNALARLLKRSATDNAFYGRLKSWCARLKPQVDPAKEEAAWKKLLEELQRPLRPRRN
jgi:putative glycosyltransferase (TIGR04348 family)